MSSPSKRREMDVMKLWDFLFLSPSLLFVCHSFMNSSFLHSADRCWLIGFRVYRSSVEDLFEWDFFLGALCQESKNIKWGHDACDVSINFCVWVSDSDCHTTILLHEGKP
jgi:hypothetical protein